MVSRSTLICLSVSLLAVAALFFFQPHDGDVVDFRQTFADLGSTTAFRIHSDTLDVSCQKVDGVWKTGKNGAAYANESRVQSFLDKFAEIQGSSYHDVRDPAPDTLSDVSVTFDAPVPRRFLFGTNAVLGKVSIGEALENGSIVAWNVEQSVLDGFFPGKASDFLDDHLVPYSTSLVSSIEILDTGGTNSLIRLRKQDDGWILSPLEEAEDETDDRDMESSSGCRANGEEVSTLLEYLRKLRIETVQEDVSPTSPDVLLLTQYNCTPSLAAVIIRMETSTTEAGASEFHEFRFGELPDRKVFAHVQDTMAIVSVLGDEVLSPFRNELGRFRDEHVLPVEKRPLLRSLRIAMPQETPLLFQQDPPRIGWKLEKPVPMNVEEERFPKFLDALFALTNQYAALESETPPTILELGFEDGTVLTSRVDKASASGESTLWDKDALLRLLAPPLESDIKDLAPSSLKPFGLLNPEEEIALPPESGYAEGGVLLVGTPLPDGKRYVMLKGKLSVYAMSTNTLERLRPQPAMEDAHE